MVPILEDKVKLLPQQSFRNGKDFFVYKGDKRGLTVVVAEEQLKLVTETIKMMLSDMKYGSITLVIQDGKVIQLEKNEKVRLK